MSPLLRALEKVSTAWRSSRKRSVSSEYLRRGGNVPVPAAPPCGNVSVAIFNKIGGSGMTPVTGAQVQHSLAGVLFLNSNAVRIIHQQEFTRWRASLR